MRKLIALFWLECYALLLAAVQWHNGVRTDEAKYLLDIPYPHPPLARWFLSLFDGFAWQEAGARALFATLMVQAAWIVWDMGRYLRMPARVAACVLWLGSAAFVLQAGTVMMAPLTALEALLFLWILSLPRERLPSAATIGFLWLATLFTALQGALLFPLVIAVVRLRGASWKTVAWYVGAPLALVALYALGNPLVLASVLVQSGKDAADSLTERTAGLAWILVLAGSGVGTLVGVAGLLRKRHPWILASFALVAAYVFVGRFEYYAVLFLPFYVTGTKHLLRRFPRAGVPLALGVVAGTAFLLAFHAPLLTPRSPARAVLGRVDGGTVLLVGSMGHEWAYEATSGQELRWSGDADPREIDAVACFRDCAGLERDWISLSSVEGLWLRP